MTDHESGAAGVALITGGASGIGLALSKAMARHGFEVVMADRQLELAEEGAATIRGAGGRASGAALDVRDLDAFRRLADEIVRRTGRIDYLFNNAGIGVGGEMDNYRREDWDDVFDVNLRGVAYGIQAVYPHMCDRHRGHIVNTASIAGLLPAANQGSYTASKHAVVGLSKALRIEAKRHGVRVSVLCPGVIRTPILHGGRFGRINLPGLGPDLVERFWARTRPMDPDDFARQALERVFRDEAIIVVPRWWKALWYLERLSPALSSMLWGKVLADTRRLIADASTAEAGASEPSGPRDARGG